ncbi:hypothetical protein A3860_14700 [Niastella vici]|uniref:Uncharacterized protein n=1 Tax=Niastella vici TaxID=1703345 RepID=A0A1V9G5J4_9BACT|nr:hypothetical protein [Niastella vici]OQP65840.1 hypothetical protein A3860_14700 [Niastella vici]
MSTLIEFTHEFSQGVWKLYISDKSKRLIEYVDEDPFYVLSEVFSDQWNFITEELRDWLIIGLSSDNTVYDDWGERLTLVVFHDHLAFLIEALIIIYVRNLEDVDKKEKIPPYKIHLLSDKQRTNPKQIIEHFFEQFPTTYIMRELDDWFTASLTYPGHWRDNVVSPYHAQRVNEKVLCLIKTAERLLRP